MYYLALSGHPGRVFALRLLWPSRRFARPNLWVLLVPDRAYNGLVFILRLVALASCTAALGSLFLIKAAFRQDSPQGIDFVHVNSPTSQKYLIETMGGGVAILDYNKDGWMDIAVTHAGAPGLTLWRNVAAKDNTSRRFERVDLPLHDALRGWGVTPIDIDNDGWADLATAKVVPVVKLGVGFPEVLAVRGDIVYRMSDLGGAPSLMAKWRCHRLAQ